MEIWTKTCGSPGGLILTHTQVFVGVRWGSVVLFLLLDPCLRSHVKLLTARGVPWVWVKITPPGGPQVLVHVSICQGSIWGTYF